MVTTSVLAASDYIRLACFRMCWCKISDMIVEPHVIGQTVIVPYMEETDSDILGLGLGFLITSSLMWISNRRHVYRVCGIRWHPNGVFSNVLMQKKRHGSRKTSDLSTSDCSVYEICRQRYLVYYESYREEIVQSRVRSETASFDKIWNGYCKKNWSYCRSYNLKQVDMW